MDVESPEERHDSSDGNNTETAEAPAQNSEKPTVILVIGDCAIHISCGQDAEGFYKT